MSGISHDANSCTASQVLERRSADAILDAMATQVRQGAFEQATELGNSFAVPLAISTTDLWNVRKLGDARHSTIDMASWNGRQVVAKRPRITTSADLERFRAELKNMLNCGQHRNIVALLAARAIPPGYLLVLPFMPSSLADRVHGPEKLSWQDVCEYAVQSAEGLAHIHACGMLHRDIKPANILLDSEGIIKISDFGIAISQEVLAAEHADARSTIGQQNPSGGFHKRHMVGTLEYMAPEILLRQPYSFPADVYAWAVAVNEAATNTRPFSDCTRDNPAAHTVLDFGYGRVHILTSLLHRQELTAAIVSQGLRPHMAPDTPPALCQLLESCWQLDTARRPTAEQAAHKLSNFISSTAPCLREGRVAEANGKNLGMEQHRQEARRAQATKIGSLYQCQETVQSRLSPRTFSGRQTMAWAQLPGHADQSTSNSNDQNLQQKIRVGSFATAGARGDDRMEDRHFIASPMADVQPQVHLMAVFDGHRGASAANYSAEHLQSALRSTSACHTGNEALLDCFAAIDNGFCRDEDQRRQVAGQIQYEGCTALAAVIGGRQLWIASAGDCRAVLCRAGKAVQLNAEHTLDSTSERERIQAAGGKPFLAQSGWRLGDAGIQISRAIGDADLKGSGLTAEPEVVCMPLLPDDTCLILASDGLWDCLSSQDAADLIRDTVKEPSMCAQRLATEALTRGSGALLDF